MKVGDIYAKLTTGVSNELGANHGKLWSIKDKELVAELYNRNHTVEYLAEVLGRSHNSVVGQLGLLGFVKYSSQENAYLVKIAPACIPAGEVIGPLVCTRDWVGRCDTPNKKYGTKWTQSEVDLVVKSWFNGVPLINIARSIDRSVACVLSSLIDGKYVIYDAVTSSYYMCNKHTLNNQPLKETTTMSVQDTFANIENVVRIAGQDASSLSDDEIFSFIARLEAQVSELNKIGNKPKKLVAKIEAIHGDINALCKYVDER